MRKKRYPRLKPPPLAPEILAEFRHLTRVRCLDWEIDLSGTRMGQTMQAGVATYRPSGTRFRVWTTNGSYRCGDFAAEALTTDPHGLMAEAKEAFRFEIADHFSPLATDDIVERKETHLLDLMIKGEI